MSTVRVLDYRTQIERQQTNTINKTPMSTTPLHKKINEKHKDTDDRRQTASLRNTDEHKTTSHKLHAKKKNLATRWTSALVCILSASLPRFVRVTSALRRKLDRIKNRLYNAVQTPAPRVSAVLRRLHTRSKGFSQSVFSVINALRCARRLVMTTLKTSHGQSSLAAFAITLIAAAIITGCGGSGGSGDTPVSPPPPITPTPVNAVMTTSVTPADGATSVARDTKLTAVFTANTGTFASTTASLSCGGVSQTITASMPVASGKMTTVTWAAASPLPYSTTCTYQVLGTAAGVDGGAQANTNTRGTFTVEQLVCPNGQLASQDGQTCVAQVLRYTDKVYALWTDKYPYAVTRTGVTKVKNMTQWNGLGKDLFLCFIANHPLADGKILTLCKDLAELKWHLLYINPEKEEMYEYTSAPPADLAYTVTPQGGIDAATFGLNWLDVDLPDPAHPTWYNFAQVAEGYYFTDIQTIGKTLRFIDNTGATTFVAEDPSGRGVTIRVLKAYSNN